MKTLKASSKLVVAMILLGGVAIAVPAQTVIGGWQGTSDDGWYRVSSGGSSLGSIFAAANDPSAFEQWTNVVAGYNKSLVIHENGYGNVRMQVNLTSVAGGLAAWTNNSKFNFTFSCPPGTTNTPGGYMQLVAIQYNSDTSGFNQITGNWATNGFSETGYTNDDSGGQPVFYYWSTAPARSQVVTWDYSAIKAAIGDSPGYLQITFVFQVGGGAPTNIFLNNVTLSGASGPVPAGTIIVDDFSPAGVSSSNPANYDYYSSAQVYSSGQITNVWGNWFGSAFSNVVWDPTTDADNNSQSGSLRINLNWTTNSSDQFVVWDQGAGNNYFALNINALQYTNFQCDVKFAPGSASDSGTYGQPIFGHLQFGDRTSSYGQDYFGGVDIPATNTGWVHVSIPLDAVADENLTNINGLLIHIYEPYYSLNLVGPSTLWVDNIKFVGPATIVSNPPPTLSFEKATPGLRIFAGSTVNTYDREELATVDQYQSWVGAGGPVSYSFTLLNYPSDINQTHIFLVPVNSSGQADMGNAGTPNEYIEYQASNTLWMVINPAGNGNVTASVQWKTNLPNANPDHTALVITNSTAVGTWTLTFNSDSTGTLTAPGASPVSFTITDPNVATDFADPLVAYFGLQPNSTTGEGQYEDWGSISVSGVAGANESEDFTSETSFNQFGYWANNSAQATSIQLATVNTPYWISWTLPDIGFGLGTAMDITGNTNTLGYPWVLPEYYNNYGDGMNIPGAANQGTKKWVLIPTTCLPTSDGQPFGPLAPNGFFRLFNPPLQN